MIGERWFTSEQWASIPLPLKERWWKDTDYGARAPSNPELILMAVLIRGGAVIDDWRALQDRVDYCNELVPFPA